MTKLEFSQKYNSEHAQQYFEKHDANFWRRLSNWRDHKIADKALEIAGNPLEVLDVPCGTGRFWELLAKNEDRIIHACDNSQNMIDTGLKFRQKSIVQRIKSFQGSAFNLPIDDNFVENVFCIRLIHHIGKHEDRLKLLSELQRVTSSTVIISLWVDGNYKSWRRKKNENKRPSRKYQNRFVIPVKSIEQEIDKVGFKIKARLDFLPFLSMWRTYVLEKRVDDNLS